MSTLKEVKKPKKQTVSTRRKSFNEWIDMIYGHVETMNQERYGINTSSTIKT